MPWRDSAELALQPGALGAPGSWPAGYGGWASPWPSRPLTAEPDVAAEPYRLVAQGRFADAARWWRQAGDPFAEADIDGRRARTTG